MIGRNCPFSGKPCDKECVATMTVDHPKAGMAFDFCDECSDKMLNGVNEVFGRGKAATPAPEGILVKLLGMPGTPQQPAKKVRGATPACGGCGLTVDDLAKGAKVGCERCYHDLGPWLKTPSARGRQERPRHKKARKEERVENDQEVEQLRKQLAMAVKAERYEDAAQIRDALRARKAVDIDPAKLAELERLMAAAVKAERYEDAAKYRDEIKALKG